MALDSRLARTCCSRCSSACTHTLPEHTSGSSVTCAALACSAAFCSASSSMGRRAMLGIATCICPASMLVTSSTSLTKASRWRPDAVSTPRRSRCSVLRFSALSLASSCANPRMLFNGVRSSWLTRARNSLRARCSFSMASRSATAASTARCSVTSAQWPCHSVTPLASLRAVACASCQRGGPPGRLTSKTACQSRSPRAASRRPLASSARVCVLSRPSKRSAESLACCALTPYMRRMASLAYGKRQLPSANCISWKIMPGAWSAARLTRSISSSMLRRLFTLATTSSITPAGPSAAASGLPRVL